VRERLLTSAAEVFALHGYHDSAVSQICLRAGSNKPMLYYHFGSKGGLFVEVVRETFVTLKLRIRGSLPARESGLERVAEFVQDYVRALAEPGSVGRAVFTELSSLPAEVQTEVIRAYDEQIVSELRAILQTSVDAAEFRPIPVEDTAIAIMAIVHGFLRRDLSAAEIVSRSLTHAVDLYGRSLLATQD